MALVETLAMYGTQREIPGNKSGVPCMGERNADLTIHPFLSSY